MLSYNKGIGHDIVTQFRFSPMVIARFRPIDLPALGLCQNLRVIVRPAPATRVPGPVKDPCPLVFPYRSAFGESWQRPPRTIDGDPGVREDIIAWVRLSMIFRCGCNPSGTPD